MNLTLELSGLHCQACVGRVTTALTPLAANVQVSLQPQQRAEITDATASTEALIAAVQGAGAYSATVAANPIATETTLVSAKIPVRVKKSAENPPTVPSAQIPPAVNEKSWQTYYPLLLLTAFLVLVPALAQWNAAKFDAHAWMRHFMAAFFLAFAFFKLLDVRAFASAYAGYDLLAARWSTWGFIYPFVELALGIAYLINFAPNVTNAVTFVVMSFSLAGVLRAVLSKKQIRCACLGAVFNLPMSTVTIVEDALMAGMALWMLLNAI